MNRKAFHPAELKLDDQGYIEAAFAQLNVVDHDGDITRPGAFPVKDVPMSAFNHTSWDGAPPVGRASISEQGGWAVFKGQYFMDTTHGRDAFATTKGLMDLAEFSYGFNILEGGPSTHEGKSVRELRKLDVFEVSHVMRGAGIGTHVLAIKSGGPGTDLPYAEHESWLREANAAFLARTKARTEMREADGRKLSRSDREALAALLDTLRAFGGTADELAALLETTDPQKAPEAPKAASDLALVLEIARARSLGIT